MARQARNQLVGYVGDDSTNPYVNSPKGVDTAAGTAHVNSLTETAIAQHVWGGRSLATGDVIEWECCVRVIDNNSTDTLTLVAYFGGTTLTTAIASLDATDVSDNDVVYFRGTITIRDADSSGTYVASTLTQNPAATGAGTLEYHYTLTASVDFTADLFLEVGADWSVAHADNEVQTETFNWWIR